MNTSYETSENREIARIPNVPELSPDTVGLLTELCFRDDIDIVSTNAASVRTDALFVFGTWKYAHQCATHVSSVLSVGMRSGLLGVRNVIIAGGIAVDEAKTESKHILELLRPNESAFPGVSFVCELRSTNTVENIRYSIEAGLLDRNIGSVLFVAINVHCGRAFLTMKKFLPQTEILQYGYVITVEGISGTMSRNFWFKDTTLAGLVWGEFLRIERYGLRGDIAFPPDVRDMVTAIRRQMGTKAAN